MPEPAKRRNLDKDSPAIQAVLAVLNSRVTTFAPGTVIGAGVYLQTGQVGQALLVCVLGPPAVAGGEGPGRVGEAAGAAEAMAPTPEARLLDPQLGRARTRRPGQLRYTDLPPSSTAPPLAPPYPNGEEALRLIPKIEYLFSLVAALGGIGTVGLALRRFGRTLCENWKERCRRKSFLLEEEARRKSRVAEIEAAGKADVARIKATGKVLHDLAKLGPDQDERLRARLERVRPPHDELQPPAAS